MVRNAAGNEHGRVRNPILDALRSCRGTILALILFSCLVNLLMLTGSFYMLQVYDRVLMSHSVPTLVLLSIIALIAYVFQGFLDVIRTRIFGRVAERVYLDAGPVIFRQVIRQQGSRPGTHNDLQSMQDLESIRMFLSGTGPVALFDMPWLPLYLGLCFLLHVWIGLFAVFSACLLIAIAIYGEYRSRPANKEASDTGMRRNQLSTSALQSAEVICAMGMMEAIERRWQMLTNDYSSRALAANDVSSGMVAISRTLRMVIQSATLGLGAYLVVKGEMTPGTIIAASIISARAIAPVDMAVGSYRAFVQARQGYERLRKLFESLPSHGEQLRMIPPTSTLTVDKVVLVSPTDGRPIVKAVSFGLKAGDALGIIGHSASGKSTLGRALVGLWHPVQGIVALDGASYRHHDPELLGRHIGYMPHDIQLFDGTIAENIHRFRPDVAPEDVYKAARSAGCYEMILALRDGFNTKVGFGGAHLSAGQRQRIGLARALFGEPFLVVLDEPNANLDANGEVAVNAAIMEIRARGGIVVVIAHRPSVISAVDLVLVMHDGFATAFGPKQDVLKNVISNSAAILSQRGGAGAQASLPGGKTA